MLGEVSFMESVVASIGRGFLKKLELYNLMEDKMVKTPKTRKKLNVDPLIASGFYTRTSIGSPFSPIVIRSGGSWKCSVRFRKADI